MKDDAFLYFFLHWFVAPWQEAGPGWHEYTFFPTLTFTSHLGFGPAAGGGGDGGGGAGVRGRGRAAGGAGGDGLGLGDSQPGWHWKDVAVLYCLLHWFVAPWQEAGPGWQEYTLCPTLTFTTHLGFGLAAGGGVWGRGRGRVAGGGGGDAGGGGGGDADGDGGGDS